jgi:prepilin-type N-terminal cleavage/methylation domain-containing protein
MKTILKSLFKSQIQCRKPIQSQNGFTLLELLVAMILAVLVITPLLGFMISVMDTDRKEQAKATSEQEIQSALDFIAQDMEQAIYIYDADGMYGNTTKGITGILGGTSQIPTGTDMVPILAFWKRYFLNKNENVTVGTTTKTASCLVTLPNNSCSNQDYMLYSLVVYYLIKNDSNTTTWNPTTTRIARWEIRSGIRNDGGTETRSETVNSITKTVKYLLLPDPGFMPFNLSLSGDLNKKMGNWVKHSSAYTKDPKTYTLVDVIDQTKITQGAPAPACHGTNEQLVPDDSKTIGGAGFPNDLKTGSFYACVNTKKNIARVYIRGNSLARIERGAQYQAKKIQYFPTATIQIKGRASLGIE